MRTYFTIPAAILLYALGVISVLLLDGCPSQQDQRDANEAFDKYNRRK